MNESLLLNSMIGKNTEFANNLFKKKKMLVWGANCLEQSLLYKKHAI